METKDVRKGLSLIAFGFLFILLNITINNVPISPSFIGWLLFFIAYPYIEKYADGKDYLKWAALILTIVTAVQWVLEIVKAPVDFGVLKSIVAVANAVFMFLFFGVLEKIARSFSLEQRAGKLSTLKYVNLISYFGTVVFSILYSFRQSTLFAVVAFLCGVVAIIFAIITCVTLFKLKNEIGEDAAVA